MGKSVMISSIPADMWYKMEELKSSSKMNYNAMFIIALEDFFERIKKKKSIKLPSLEDDDDEERANLMLSNIPDKLHTKLQNFKKKMRLTYNTIFYMVMTDFIKKAGKGKSLTITVQDDWDDE